MCYEYLYLQSHVRFIDIHIGGMSAIVNEINSIYTVSMSN